MKQRKTILTLFQGLFFLVSFSSILAQEYSLTLNVSDIEKSQPLEGVTVLLSPCNCGGITNSSGIFSKRLKGGKYNLLVEYLGYGSKQLTVDLNSNQSFKVEMQIEEEQLSEVVLLAQKRNQNVETPQMGVLELNVRDLIKVPTVMGEFDVLKSITLMAGVNSSGDVSNGVSIRG